MKILKRFRINSSIGWSLALHLVLILLLAFNMPSKKLHLNPLLVKPNVDLENLNQIKEPKKIISAGLIDKKLVAKASQRQKSAEQRRRREARTAAKRVARAKQELKKIKQQANKTKQQISKAKSAVQKAKAVAKKEQQRAKQAKELANKARQEEMLAKKKAEQETKRAKKIASDIEKEKQIARKNWLDSEFARFVSKIKYNVLANRSLTFAFDKDLVAEIQIKLHSNGEIVDVKIAKTSGNPAYDNNSKTAVFKAAPFDMPNDVELNNRLRNIVLVFRQEER